MSRASAFRANPAVAVLGDGQLARMLALAALPLGVRIVVVGDGVEPHTTPFTDRVPWALLDATADLASLAERVDVFTVESENVDPALLDRIADLRPLHPSAVAIRSAQDRLHERSLLERWQIPCAPWRRVDSAADLGQAVVDLGLPLILKTRRFGYDGKGQRRLHEAGDLRAVPDAMLQQGLIAERLIRFTRELSLVCTRSLQGEVVWYPLVENRHRHGILVRTDAPAAGVDTEEETVLRDRVGGMLEALGYVGTFAIELFDTRDGMLANEMAPRVHNTGHWTQDGAETSQFENHVRAITGRPLGSAQALGRTVMFNLIGGLPDLERLLALPGVRLHLYDKAPRPGRKLGHVNVCERLMCGGPTASFDELVAEVEALIAPRLDFGPLAPDEPRGE